MNFLQDLKPFADPATDIEIVKNTGSITETAITRNGERKKYSLDHKTGAIRCPGNIVFPSMASLLASSDFANIKLMTDIQRRLYQDVVIENYIDPEGYLDKSPFNYPQLSSAIQPEAGNNEQLKIVLLDGPAGVGKTSLVNRILIERARGFARAQNYLPPILHVTSRGRKLSSLEEALAQSIQLIRGSFTFDQVPTLVRYGLIQLAIDGFDELVDPDGYKDAWYALRDFLHETESGGPIILAGRDTFFDQQSFTKRLEENQTAHKLIHIQLTPVSPNTASRWLSLQGWQDDDIEQLKEEEILKFNSYALRPYFLSVIAKSNADDIISDCTLSARDYLISKFIERESVLVATNIDIDASTAKTALVNLFQEIALEMANNETESIDLAFLQLATEFIFADYLSEHDLNKLKHKSGSFALLESDERSDHRRFPHTEISHFFLATSLISSLIKKESQRVLRRGILTTDFISIFQDVFETISSDEAKKTTKEIQRLLETEISYDKQNGNLSTLLIAASNRVSVDHPVTIENCTIDESKVSGSPAKLILSETTINRADFRNANLTNVQFKNTTINTLLIDNTTIFGQTQPTVFKLQKQLLDTFEEYFSPDEIANNMPTTGSKPTSLLNSPDANKEAIWFLERFCRVMLRQHYIKNDPEDQEGVLLSNPYWAEVQEILENSGRLKVKSKKAVSGPRGDFFHIVNAAELLEDLSKSEQQHDIWKQIASLPKIY